MMDFFTHEFRMEQGASIGKIAIKSIEKGKDGETYLIKGIAYALINGKESDLKYYFKADVKKINPKGMALVSFPKIIPDLEGKLTEDSMMINLFWNNDDEVFRRVMWGEFSK
ncbi:MAG TPA: hypothetical protein PKA31_02005 [Candidatus Moranbacteria bacterium]|mgnify:CR=1 FL=1|nr:hypothetical protein [Candidatus Moranbacteria bacterium]